LREAEKELTKCLELEENNVVALSRLMNIKMQHNDTDAAERAIEKVIPPSFIPSFVPSCCFWPGETRASPTPPSLPPSLPP